ncbi:MAG TPA: 50S ribosomal protein L18 [Thermoplasmata archaeon]|nr:50S ribosomal protein L18 [Thermoplasmata archaeon]
MAEGAGYKVPMRRRREGRTDYRRRLRLLRGGRPRAVVRKSLNNLSVQFADYDARGDRIRISAVSVELSEYGWTGPAGNVPAAYLTGFLAGKRAAAQGIKAAVLDLGRVPPTKGSRVFAAVKGLVDAGVAVPHAEEVLPEPARISGQHIKPEVVQMFEQVKAKLEAL